MCICCTYKFCTFIHVLFLIEVVLCHIGNKLPTIPIGSTQNHEKTYEYVKTILHLRVEVKKELQNQKPWHFILQQQHQVDFKK